MERISVVVGGPLRDTTGYRTELERLIDSISRKSRAVSVVFSADDGVRDLTDFGGGCLVFLSSYFLEAAVNLEKERKGLAPRIKVLVYSFSKERRECPLIVYPDMVTPENITTIFRRSR